MKNPFRFQACFPQSMFMMLSLLLFMALNTPAQAVTDPAELMADPAQEAQAERIGAQLRCLVCQNESIEDSAAPLAHDLRQAVRDQLRQGKNEAEIMAWMDARYGEFIRLEPRFTLSTALLWLTPVLTLLAGFWLSRRFWQKKPASTVPTPLTPEERAQLDRLLHDQPRTPTP